MGLVLSASKFLMIKKKETMKGAREGEEEEDGDIRPGLDPFLQPPILKAFFKQLSMEELAKCRLVSTLWCSESLSTWRSKATLKLKFGKGGIVSTRDDGSTRTTSLGEFLDLWEASDWGSGPFKRFGLYGWKFKAEDVEQQRFLEMVGGHVTSLTIYKCSFIDRDNFRKIIFQAFPKLQYLKMDNCDLRSGFDPQRQPEDSLPLSEDTLSYKEPACGVHGLNSLHISEFPRSSVLMDMLSHFHKVKSLHLAPAAGQADYRNLLETIRLIREQDPTKLPLKDFDVKFELVFGEDTASFIVLLELQDLLDLPLQRLQICFDFEDDAEEELDNNLNNEDVFKDILQRHSSTLKWMEFEDGDDPLRICKSFPFGISFENLEELSLSTHLFGSLNFLKATPKLRVLRMKHAINDDDLGMAESDNLFSNSAELEIGDWTLPFLTELGLRLPSLSVCNLKKLMKWMPNLENLSGIELDDIKFAMVCSDLKNLKILDDWGEELTDEGIIGKENARGADGDKGTQNVPNITKLKNLTTFETMSSRLTSASVHKGFLKLANLKELSLGNYNELDNEAKAALKRRKIRGS